MFAALFLARTLVTWVSKCEAEIKNVKLSEQLQKLKRRL